MGPLDSALDLGNTRYSFTFVPNVENPLAPKVGELNKIGRTVPFSWEMLLNDYKPKEKKMTQTFKAGDRVKLTKGDDTIITTLTASTWDSDRLLVKLSKGVSVWLTTFTDDEWEVEKLSPPLPETPGSVILYDGDYWVRGLTEDTRNSWGSVEETRDSDEFEGEAFEVFFDAATVVA